MHFVGIIWLLTLLLPQYGGDVLDTIPTDTYWQARNVVVTPAVMESMARGSASDISSQIKQLSSETPGEREAAIRAIAAAGPGAVPQLEELAKSTDPRLAKLATNLIQQANRRGNQTRLNRLMAIRTLGETRQAASLPLLRELSTAKEAFVADYALEAIAAIEGKSLPSPAAATREARDKDLWLLPANCGLVAQLDLSGAVQRRSTATTQPMESRSAMMMSRTLMGLDQVGNFRIDRVTVGVSSAVGPRQGFFVLIGRGKYDHAAVSDLLRRQGATVTTSEGMAVFSPDRDVQIVLPDENTLVFIARAGEQDLSAAEVVRSLKSGEGTLKGNAAMAAALDATNRAVMLYAAAVPSDAYRALPLPFPMPYDMLRLTAASREGKLRFDLQADGNDAAAIEEAVKTYRGLVMQAVGALEQPARQHPAAKLAQDFMKSITIKNADTNVSATAELNLSAMDLNTLMGIH